MKKRQRDLETEVLGVGLCVAAGGKGNVLQDDQVVSGQEHGFTLKGLPIRWKYKREENGKRMLCCGQLVFISFRKR